MPDAASATAVYYAHHPSPVGRLLLCGEGGSLTGLFMEGGRHDVRPPAGAVRDDAALAEAAGQLDAYFAGERTAFDLPVRLRGTPFQRRVWAALGEIPHGTTTTYGALAARLGRPTASRAVGLANGRNPVSIVVPCHRVIGASGALTGYGGGTANKRLLLDLEAAGRAPALPGFAA